MAAPSPKKQLDAFVAKFSPAVATSTKKALAAMRKRLPGALERVYDNYNALAIAFGPTARLANPDVCALMDQAPALAKAHLDPKQKHRIVIKSISARQRPRRPT